MCMICMYITVTILQCISLFPSWRLSLSLMYWFLCKQAAFRRKKKKKKQEKKKVSGNVWFVLFPLWRYAWLDFLLISVIHRCTLYSGKRAFLSCGIELNREKEKGESYTKAYHTQQYTPCQYLLSQVSTQVFILFFIYLGFWVAHIPSNQLEKIPDNWVPQNYPLSWLSSQGMSRVISWNSNGNKSHFQHLYHFYISSSTHSSFLPPNIYSHLPIINSLDCLCLICILY